MFPKIPTSSIRSQQNVTVCSTDDEPSNDSINNTSTICLPSDHSFFRPYSGDELNHASTNNINPNASPTTPLQEDKENRSSQNFQGSDCSTKNMDLITKQPFVEADRDAENSLDIFQALSSEYHDKYMNEINNHKITNDLITNLPNNRQLQLPIIHEKSAKNHTNDSTSCTINNVKFYTENTKQDPIKNKINIISDVVIKLPDKVVLGNGKCDLIL